MLAGTRCATGHRSRSDGVAAAFGGAASCKQSVRNAAAAAAVFARRTSAASSAAATAGQAHTPQTRAAESVTAAAAFSMAGGSQDVDQQRGRQSSGRGSPGAADQRRQRRPGCVFCDLQDASDGRIIYQDEELFAFHDRVPAARLHILVCPKAHIPNTSSLCGPADADLVQRMAQVGRSLLLERATALPPAAAPAAGGGHVAAALRRCCACCRPDGQRRRGRRLMGSSGEGSDGLLRGADRAAAANGGSNDATAEGTAPETAALPPRLLFGFHKPPWRSVDHLHMHCFLLPLRPAVALKYRWRLNWVEAGELESRLRRGGGDMDA